MDLLIQSLPRMCCRILSVSQCPQLQNKRIGSIHLYNTFGTSLVVQWLRFCAPNTEGMNLIPSWGWVMVESSDKCGPLEKGMANHFSILALRTPWAVWNVKNRTLKDELPRSVGAQYATGDQWRNNSRKNEGMEPKQTQYPAVDVTGDGSKVRCCKEQYYIGTWNVRSMNQGKLEVVK